MIKQKSWTTPEGKVIPFTQERVEIDGWDDDEDTYYLEINTFFSNTQLSFVKEAWDYSEDDGSEPRKKIIINKWQTLPNNDFLAKRDEIIKEAIRIIENHLGIKKNRINWDNVPEVISPAELNNPLRFEEYETLNRTIRCRYL